MGALSADCIGGSLCRALILAKPHGLVPNLVSLAVQIKARRVAVRVCSR